MAGFKTPTTLFLAMLVLPALILAWLGWQASAPLVEELRGTAREEAGTAAKNIAAELPARLEAVTAAQAHLPEWASFRRWRERLERGGVATVEALASAHAFVAPALQALAVAEVAAKDAEAAPALVVMPWSQLQLAGPRPVEVLRTSDGGRVALAAGHREGWLAEVPATEAARSVWWQAAGAAPEEQLRQALRERAAAGEPVLRVAAALGSAASLELLLDPLVALATVQRSLASADCDLGLAPGDEPTALHWSSAGVASITIPTAWRPVEVTASHRSLSAIEAGAWRQRWVTAVGIGLLLGSIVFGTALVRRALLQERRARTLRDEFIANVSHELKTPLTSVRMYAAMLADPALDPASRVRHGAIAEAEAARLGALVDDLLDFAALERGVRRLEPEPVDLAAAAHSLTTVWQARAASIDMQLVCCAEGETLALADATALLRILTNLLQNACRHGRPARNGSPSRITVEVGPGPAIEVRDNGPGVPVADRERIFGRFERARSGGEGTGLGLALSRDLARACGGGLVCSDSGTETIFRLTLPAVPPPEEPT